MRNYLFITFIFIFSFASAQSNYGLDVLVFSGTYQGEKVFVQNPFDREGIGFSVKHVEVNGSELTGQVFSSAFEVDLEKLGLKKGDSISIHLFYNSDKEPKVINTWSLSQQNKNFKLQLTDFRIESDSILKWCFEGEEERSDFIIEEYRWKRWLKIGEVKSVGSLKKSCYEFIVPELISGENQFRIVQFSSDDTKLTSKVVKENSKVEEVYLLEGNCSGGSFHFDRDTYYEIFDTYGNIVRRGFSDCPKFCGLDKGLYYICYGGTAGEVFNIKHRQDCN